MKTDASPFPDGEGYANVLPHPRSSAAPRDTEPNIVIRPSETLERTVNSNEPIPGSASVIPGAVAPSKSGEYRLVYSYDTRAFVNFKVVDPKFEQIRVGKIRLSAGERERWINAFVVSFQERRYIMRSHRFEDQSSRIRFIDNLKIVQHNLALLAPYERIAEVNGPVTELAVVDGSGYQTAIRWRDAAGRLAEHTVAVDQPKPR
jgi:hypothetical protein